MDLHAPRIAEFLARQSEKQFCATCLAFALPCSEKEIRSTLATSAAKVTFTRGAGQCATCDGWTVVFGLSTRDAELRAPEDRLADFLQARPGMQFCHTCLRHNLPMTHHVVRKAADRLRMAGTARLAGGRCVMCERLRLVIGHEVGDEGGALRPGIA